MTNGEISHLKQQAEKARQLLRQLEDLFGLSDGSVIDVNMKEVREIKQIEG